MNISSLQTPSIHNGKQEKSLSAKMSEKDIADFLAKIDEKTRLLRLHEVENIVGMKKTQIYQMMRDGSFPKPLRLGPNSVAWSNIAIQDWITKKVIESLGLTLLDLMQKSPLNLC